MSRKRNWVRRDEFRKNRSKGAGGHPVYIYAKVGNRYRFLGITHSPVTQGVKNIPLEKIRIPMMHVHRTCDRKRAVKM